MRDEVRHDLVDVSGEGVVRQLEIAHAMQNRVLLDAIVVAAHVPANGGQTSLAHPLARTGQAGFILCKMTCHIGGTRAGKR